MSSHKYMIDDILKICNQKNNGNKKESTFDLAYLAHLQSWDNRIKFCGVMAWRQNIKRLWTQ